jgi:hypothetical protein
MTDKFDEGAIIAQEPVAFPADSSFVSYLLNAANAGRRLTHEALPAYLDGRVSASVQDESIATYPRTRQEEMMISSALPAEDVRLRSLFFGQRRALGLKDYPQLRVSGFVRDLGPATGAPRRVRATTIELDTLDRRVLLKRRTAWSSLRSKLAAWKAYIATPN